MTFNTDQLRTPDRIRSGAHRPHRSPLLEVLPVLLVLLAVLGVGVGVWQLNRSTASTVAASGGPADGAGAGADPTTSAAPTATTPSATPSATPSTTPSTTSVPTSTATATSGGVDRAVTVSVLNATKRSGLARRAASALRAGGWAVTTGNERGQSPPTTVFFLDTDQQATAQAIADDLGGSPAVEQSSAYRSITVVLGDDYAG